MHKKGDVRYLCYCNAEDNFKITFNTMVCRSIIGGYSYWIHKIQGITWVKLSSKHGDWGWDPNLDSIWRTKCWMRNPLSNHGFGTTKLAAARLMLAAERSTLKMVPKWTDTSEEDIAEIKAECNEIITRLAKYVKRYGRK
jgi:hypothetical protein